jgi:stress-induced morphogen
MCGLISDKIRGVNEVGKRDGIEKYLKDQMRSMYSLQSAANEPSPDSK